MTFSKVVPLDFERRLRKQFEEQFQSFDKTNRERGLVAGYAQRRDGAASVSSKTVAPHLASDVRGEPNSPEAA